MLKRLTVQMTTGADSALTFVFPATLHVFTFAVSSQDGEVLWKLIPEDATSVASAGAKFWTASVPADMLSADHSVIATATETDHVMPALSSITYGQVPVGYNAEQAAPALRNGESYHVVFLAEEGHGGCSFTIGDVSAHGSDGEMGE